MVAIAQPELVARQHPRVPLADPVFLQVAGWASLSAAGRDVSYGGISLQLPHEVTRGDRMIFDAEGADGSHYELVGEVRYVRHSDAGDYVAGLRWLNADDRAGAFIEAFVDDTPLVA